MEPDDLLTVAEVAARLRVGPDKVYRLINTQKLPATKLGNRHRIRWADYLDFIKPAPRTQRPRTQRENIAHLIRRTA